MIDSARDAMVVKSWISGKVFSLSLLKTSYKANELMYEQLTQMTVLLLKYNMEHLRFIISKFAEARKNKDALSVWRNLGKAME